MKSKTLEEKLHLLEQCGLKLAPPFTVDDLLQSWERSEFEEPGWNLMLVGLGMTEEKEPWRNHCVNLWHFDTEAIQDDGDYARIAARLAGMTQGSLQLENIRDHFDLDRKNAWLSFRHRGNPIRIDCRVDDDWVDPSIFSRFVELLEQSDPSKVFIYYDLGGQDCIIGCVRRTELQKLQGLGIAFEPLG